jgi:N-acetylneuraminic acid mutarotase
LIGEKIYIPGGRGADGSPTDILEIYDPRRDAWSTGSRLPKAVSAYALADFEGQLYLFGGWDGTGALDTVYVYDPQTDDWQVGTPMSTSRYHAGAAQAGGKIFVMGGWDGDQAVNTSESYLPSRDQDQEIAWNVETPMPIPLYGMSVQQVTDIIFIVGGRSTRDHELGLMYYSINQNKWFEEPLEALDDPITFASSVAIGGQIYHFGGKVDDQITGRAESFQAIYTVLLPFTINQ